MIRRFILTRLLCLAGAWPATALAAEPPVDTDFFERRIRPVLADHCYSCHSAGAERLRAELRVDSREGLLAGGETGPALVPGDPAASRLLRALTHEDPDLQMPPKTRLPDAVQADVARWIKAGAPWPAEAVAATSAPAPRAGGGFDLHGRRDAHWAWQPVRPQSPPQPSPGEWARTDIDRFIEAAWRRHGLRPAADADRRSLARRASLTLTGLPPAPADVERLVKDPSPEAFGRYVDALLGSPHFGEHWGRHWLDKVRYAETLGHEFDYPVLGAWRYRDYVIRAFNDDLPYPRFAAEQIAGDLLPVRRVEGIDQGRVATLHYWLPQQVHSPVDVRANQIEIIDNQLDVVSKAFLGLTVSCARCHDHKFDAISARDYYGLYGVLSSSRYAIQAVDDPASRRAIAEELLQLRDARRETLVADWERRGRPLLQETGGWAGSVEARPGDVAFDPATWWADGDAFTTELPRESAGQVAALDPAVTRLVRPGWWHSAVLSRRFQGAVRTPTFVLDRDRLHLRVAGRGGRWGLIIEGFVLVRAPIYGGLRQVVRNENPHWVSLDVRQWKGKRAYVEFLDNTALDPASEIGGDGSVPEGWVAAGAVVLSDQANPPTVRPARAPEDPVALVHRWKATPGALSEDEVAWVEATLSASGAREASTLATRRSDLDGRVTAPVLTAGMVEGTGWDEPVMVRGNHRSPGAMAPRRFLEAVSAGPDSQAFQQGSGRAALAAAVTAPDNPLFGRVMVNWVWAHLFDRGLVASVDNFGALGEAPTHPELLDWLTIRFQASGSVKGLIREVVTSRVWQLNSQASDAVMEEKDPQNRWLHRAPVRRATAESIRDSMLAVSGRLDPQVGGASVPIHLTAFMEGRGRPDKSGPLDGAGRRSVYLEVRRNFLSPFMLAFDTPVPATTVGRRTLSNVPAQALALMNDPLVVSLAQSWAERVLGGSAVGLEGRVEQMYLEAFARPPETEEVAEARRFLEERSRELPAGVEGERAAWADLGHALFNTKEFLFYP